MSWNLYLSNGLNLYQTPTKATFEILGGQDPAKWDHEEIRERYIQWVHDCGFAEYNPECVEEHIQKVRAVENPEFYWL